MTQLGPSPDRNYWRGTDSGFEFELHPRSGKADDDTLRENASYILRVRSSADLSEPILRIGGISNSSEPLWVKDRDLVSELAVGSEFGRLEIEVDDGLAKGAVWIDVRPRHLNLETDFAAMHQDLRRFSYSLSYELWRQTFQTLYPDFRVPAGGPEWLALLRAIWAKTESALRIIEQDPNKELAWRREVVHVDRAARVDRQGIRWLSVHSEAWETEAAPGQRFGLRVGSKVATPRRVQNAYPEVIYDTPANRALKAMLINLERRLARTIESVGTLDRHHFAAGQKDEYAGELVRILRQTRRFLTAPFLSEVQASSSMDAERIHGIRADPRYRVVVRNIQLLKWGLLDEIKGPPIRVSLKDTWLLYEYWVFLYILALYGQWGWRCTRQGVLTNYLGGGLALDIQRGDASRSSFEKRDPDTGEIHIATITFHKAFPKSITQHPIGLGALTVNRDVDVYLELIQNGVPRRIALDPKYRSERAADGCPTCPPSAVDDMHVYRDSVGRWVPRPGGGEMFERILDGAFAIFPSNEEDCFLKQLFAQTIPYGVGAFPLIPSPGLTPRMFATWLDSVS